MNGLNKMKVRLKPECLAHWPRPGPAWPHFRTHKKHRVRQSELQFRIEMAWSMLTNLNTSLANHFSILFFFYFLLDKKKKSKKGKKANPARLG